MIPITEEAILQPMQPPFFELKFVSLCYRSLHERISLSGTDVFMRRVRTSLLQIILFLAVCDQNQPASFLARCFHRRLAWQPQQVQEAGEVEEEEETSPGTSHGKAAVAGMMERTGMEGMIPTRMARMRSTPAGTATAGGARSVSRRLT